MTATERPARALPGRAALRSIHLLLVLSGLAGLGYQIVWVRMLSVGLGHEVFAVLAVVSAFFAGLAAGALAFDRRIARSRRPGLWYAALEVLIGLWALALIWLIPAVNAWVAAMLGPEPGELFRAAVTFAVPTLLLMPATVAMGATMPAAERLYARMRRDTRGIGGLYAANTAGAMAGALLTAFLVIPAFGFSATLAVFAAINLGCAALALAGPARGEAARAPMPQLPALGIGQRRVLALLFATGLLGVGYEVVVVRALAQLFQNTVYSFAAVLVVYLLGTALGAAAYQWRMAAGGTGREDALLPRLVGLTAAAAALGIAALLAIAPLQRPLFGAGGADGGSILLEFAAAGAVFLVPSAAMGALFAHLAQAARRMEGGIGAAFAANTCGAALAPAVLGVLAVPLLGVVTSLVAIVLGYLAVLAATAGALPAGHRLRSGLGVAGLIGAVAAALVAMPFGELLVRTEPGERVRAHLEGVAASATVVEDRTGERHLRVNGTFTMGGTASYTLDRLQGHLALMQHPGPRRALFLGVGTGATLAAGARHPRLRVDGVELLPEVLALIPEFPAVERDLRDAASRLDLVEADARRFVRATGTRYDVIVADNFHPAKDGAGLLYTREHFQAIRARLDEDGVFVQWLPLHQMDLATLRLIARTFLDVFPDARLQMGNYNVVTPLLALTGSRTGRPPALKALRRGRLAPGLARELEAIGLSTPFALFGGFLAGPKGLAAFAGPGALNTDDHPRALFEAPRSVYTRIGPPAERLLALTRAFAPRAPEAVDAGDGLEARLFDARLERYWQARNAFLALGADVAGGAAEGTALAELGRALVAVVRLSPDFAPAYTPVLRMAERLAPLNRAAALALLAALDAAHPERRDAARLRARLAGQS